MKMALWNLVWIVKIDLILNVRENKSKQLTEKIKIKIFFKDFKNVIDIKDKISVIVTIATAELSNWGLFFLRDLWLNTEKKPTSNIMHIFNKTTLIKNVEKL